MKLYDDPGLEAAGDSFSSLVSGGFAAKEAHEIHRVVLRASSSLINSMAAQILWCTCLHRQP